LELHTFSYGCLFLGTDPLDAAWPRGRRLFSVNGLNRPSAVEGRALGISDYQRFDRINWGSFFNKHPHPPDMLVVRIPNDPILESSWESRFLDQHDRQPKYLIMLE
jgi:hypothetical protein